MYFNPRTREGCDIKWSCIKEGLNYFNPRTREGCDLCEVVYARLG